MRQQNLLKAGLWMGMAILSFSAMAVAGRELLADMNTFELMLYRSALGFFVVCGLMAAIGAVVIVVANLINLRDGARRPRIA